MEVFHEGMRNRFRSDPRRFLHKGTIQRQDLFDSHGDRVIDLRACEIRQRDQSGMFVPMLCDGDSHKFQQELHLVNIGTRKIQQQNLLAAVLYEMDTIVHRFRFPLYCPLYTVSGFRASDEIT